MKACVLHSIGNLRYEQVPDPIRKPGEVLIKIRASGICGSDIPRVFEKGTYHFPTIPGHEFGGEIIQADDTSLVGKRCAVFPLLPCRKCINCQTGQYAQCSDYNYFGSRCDGGFAELISVPLWNVVLAPDDLSYELIALAEPCAVALHSLEHASLPVGARVCIIGAGPIGIMISKWAKLKGASKVCLVDIDKKKIDFAQKLGFETDIDGKYDIVIEGTGSSPGLETAILVAKTFGTVVLMGNPAKDMTMSQKTYWAILREELTLKGTWNSSYNISKNDWSTAIMHMNQLDLSCLVTHTFGLDKHDEAFSVIRDAKELVSKVMFVNND